MGSPPQCTDSVEQESAMDLFWQPAARCPPPPHAGELWAAFVRIVFKEEANTG